MSRLAVGLNLLHVTARSGGMHTYARELIPALLATGQVRLVGFVGRDFAPDLRAAGWAQDVEWATLPVSWDYARPWNPLAMAAAQWAVLPALAARHRLDVLHGTAGIGPPLSRPSASVVTVHDAIWLRFPRTMSRRATLAMRTFVPLGARRADRVIALSRPGRDEIVTQLGLDERRVDVVAHGAPPPGPAEAEADVRAALGLGPGRVLVCVAQLLPHKNLAGLLRALLGVPDDVTLVLVGAHTPHEAKLRSVAEHLGVGGRVRFAGWLPARRLEGLYALAAGVVLPSFDEGFGLPALEAMRRGIPVACSDIPALRETTDGGALVFDPHDPGAITQAVLALLSGEASGRVASACERASRFTWERTARLTLASYRRALEQRRAGDAGRLGVT